MKSGMMLNPSDVVVIPFPYSDLKSSKRHPVLARFSHRIARLSRRNLISQWIF